MMTQLLHENDIPVKKTKHVIRSARTGILLASHACTPTSPSARKSSGGSRYHFEYEITNRLIGKTKTTGKSKKTIIAQESRAGLSTRYTERNRAVQRRLSMVVSRL